MGILNGNEKVELSLSQLEYYKRLDESFNNISVSNRKYWEAEFAGRYAWVKRSLSSRLCFVLFGMDKYPEDK